MKSKKDYKKSGFAAESVGAIVTLIVGVGVSVLVLIFIGTLGGQTYNIAEDNILEIGNTTITNSSFVALNNTAVDLGYENIHSGSLLLYNESDKVALANFTIDYTAGTLKLLTEEGFNNSQLNASFNYGDLEIQTSVKDGIKAGFSALEQTGDYLPLIVLAVVITLVMSLVLSLGNMGGNVRGGSAL